MTKVIGLSGNIAAGKSKVIDEFILRGAVVLDCDKVVAQLYEAELLEEFKKIFPEVIENGKISKRLIKQYIMPNEDKRQALEEIVHPLVSNKVAAFIAQNPNKLVVLEIQLLFEKALYNHPAYQIDHTILVTAPFAQRFARSRWTRPHMTDDDFYNLDSMQMPQQEKAALADFVIDNRDGANPKEQVAKIIRAIELKEKFYEEWKKLAHKLDFDEKLSRVLCNNLFSAYSNNSRHYHSVAHIVYFLELFERFKDKIEYPDEFALAIFFHDKIYEISRNKKEKTNETASAEDAEAELKKLGYPQEKIERVKKFILATERHLDTGDEEVNLFLDMDLSILATQPETYDIYAENVRKEFVAAYTAAEFRAGRAQFLKQFIQRETIFFTEDFKVYDQLAKNNLQRELSMTERQPLTGIYAGSFDPITRGHMGIICESVLKLDRLVIGIGKNPDKKGWMTIDERKELIKAAIEDFKTEVKNNDYATPTEKEAIRKLELGLCDIEIESYEGKTIDFAIKHKATQLMRGLRPIGDFEGEQSLADANRKIANARNYPISTTFLPTPDQRYIFASSSIIRTLANEPVAINDYIYPSTAEAVAKKVRLEGKVGAKEKG